MSTDVLVKQMADEEKLYSREVSRLITESLNSSATIKQADKINLTSGGWPYPATKEMLALYKKTADKSWAKLRSGYSHVDMKIDIDVASSGKPSATASAKYQGEFKGGKSYMLAPGDTIKSIAKSTYGFECYTNEIWEANDKILGKQCRQIPAGFGIELPQIWVPKWKKEPKTSCAAGTEVKAVKILYPTIQVDLSAKKVGKKVIYVGIFVIEITLSVEGKINAQKKGTLGGAKFDLKSYTGEISKSVGSVAGTFKADFKEGKVDGELAISSSKIKGINLEQKITIKKGALRVSVGTAPAKFKVGDISCEGTITVSADIRIWPSPIPPVVPVRKPKPIRVNWYFPVAVVGVGVVGVAVIVGSGGTAAPAVGGGAAMILAAAT